MEIIQLFCVLKECFRYIWITLVNEKYSLTWEHVDGHISADRQFFDKLQLFE